MRQYGVSHKFMSFASCRAWKARLKSSGSSASGQSASDSGSASRWVRVLDEPMVVFTVELRRHFYYYLANLIVPTLLTTAVAFFSPLIPPESGAHNPLVLFMFFTRDM